jgi:hypothetical protein
MKILLLTIFILGSVVLQEVNADDFYVACQAENTIVKIKDDTVATVASAKSFFWGMAADRSGNLYVPDFAENRILRYAAGNGTLSTIPTVFAEGLRGPKDIHFDEAGNLYEVEESGNINKFINSGGALSSSPVLFIDGSKDHADLVGSRTPTNLAFDRQGNLYVSIMIGGILRFSNTASGLSKVPDAKPFSTVCRARQIAFDKEGNLFTADHMANCIYEFPKLASGLSSKPILFATGNGLNGPEGMAFDSQGSLYVTNWGCNSGTDILEYPSTNGALSDTPVVFGSGFSAPNIIVAAKSTR